MIEIAAKLVPPSPSSLSEGVARTMRHLSDPAFELELTLSGPGLGPHRPLRPLCTRRRIPGLYPFLVASGVWP